jgi:hypothetical protein
MGLTLYFGGGYSWPVLYGTRLIFGATAQLRLVKDSTMYGIGPTLGILF